MGDLMTNMETSVLKSRAVGAARIFNHIEESHTHHETSRGTTDAGGPKIDIVVGPYCRHSIAVSPDGADVYIHTSYNHEGMSVHRALAIHDSFVNEVRAGIDILA